MTAAVFDRPLVEPVHLGPTWEIDPNWDGVNELFKYILPERTLGWQIIDWIEGTATRPAMLLADEVDEDGNRMPFKLTREQKRFLLWWYAIDARGRFVYRDGVLQRIKGWGKDPIVAVIATVEFVGPCRFGGWITDPDEAADLGLEVGDPRGVDHPRAWIQIAAVSKDQPLALDTPVRIPSGWTTVEKLTVGDYVYDEAGQAQRVVRETEVFHDLDCYRLIFDDGQEVVASAQHGWTVERLRSHGDRHVVETLTTEQLAESYLDRAGRRRVRIPVVGVESPDVTLPIDPYLLGLWLGDGNRCNGTIAIDWRHRDEIEQILRPLLGQHERVTWQHVANNTGVLNVRNTSRHAANGPAFISRLRDLGVLGSKHVPDLYAFAGTAQRRALLQGLVDSDGCVLPDGQVRFINTDSLLIDGVRDLVASLGYKAHVRPHGTVGWIVGFRPGTEPVARLRHKVDRQCPVVKPQSRYRYLRHVERVEPVPVKCVGIDTPSHLFQVGRGVVTHNTRNTMTLFPGLFSPACMRECGIKQGDIGKEIIYAQGGARRIEAVTSSPRAIEGGRPTFVVRNEALALDTPIPTPAGWTTMGCLADGDVIFGDDGQPCVVTKAHPVQHERECYRVTFADGTSIVASDGHWWQTAVAGSAAKPRRRTTGEMHADGRRFMVPRAGERQTEPVDLPVDPYLLGVWLGDGSTGACHITVGSEDVDTLREQLALRGIETHALAGDGAPRLSFSTRTGFGARMGPRVARELRALPCYRDKHIPRTYMQAGTEQRRELLRGLMDTDGCATTDGRCVFVGRERLARDVLELVRSLGQVATMRFAPDRRSREGGTWRVTFSPRGVQPFCFPRKAARVGSTARGWVSIVSIEPVASVPVRCISVDSPTRLFQAGEAGHVTSNTHHWILANEGHQMAYVIDRNVTKSKGGAARALSITNAYNPADDSVAQHEREAWELQATGQSINTGVLYDSLEAPADATLLLPKKPDGSEPTEAEIRAHIGSIVAALRGDAWWLDVERIVDAILDPRNPPGNSRRFYYNQIVASEDAWLDPRAIRAAKEPMVDSYRRGDFDQLRAGWIVAPGEPIVMFFDGSKSRDATGLVGCRVEDGYVFTIGVWAKPPGEAGKTWTVPRIEVDDRVREAFNRFNIIAFWGDPSHATDDDVTRYWDPYLDDWHRTYSERLAKETWATTWGTKVHSIMWDMTSPQRSEQFVAAAETFVEEIENTDEDGLASPLFLHDGHPALMDHLGNARRYPTRWGVSLWKGSRESAKKIDLAVCAVGARMLRRIVLNKDIKEQEPKGKRPGQSWGSR